MEKINSQCDYQILKENFDKDIYKTIQKFVRENITQEHIDCAKREIEKYFKQINENFGFKCILNKMKIQI